MIAKKISCPTCQSNTLWSPSNPYRPFCSDRCRLIDLGEWFSDKNSIPCSNQSEQSDS